MARRPRSVAALCYGRRDTGGLALSSTPVHRNGVPLPPAQGHRGHSDIRRSPRRHPAPNCMPTLLGPGPMALQVSWLRGSPVRGQGAQTPPLQAVLVKGGWDIQTLPDPAPPSPPGVTHLCPGPHPQQQGPRDTPSQDLAAFPRPTPWLWGPFPITHTFPSQASAGETCPKSHSILIAHPGPQSHMLAHPGCRH